MGNIAVEGLEVLLALFVGAAIVITFVGGSLTGISELFMSLFIIGVFAALAASAFSVGR